MTSTSNLRLGNVWTDKLFEMINQQFQVLWKKISSVAYFCDPFQGAKGAKSYGFSCMRAQFLLCQRAYVMSLIGLGNTMLAFSKQRIEAEFLLQWKLMKQKITVTKQRNSVLNLFVVLTNC